MTDVDGVQHRQTVPFGKVKPEVWTKQQAYSTVNFAAPIREIVSKIEKPFVTAISDCISPRSAFSDGKLFLVGDALALFRPHAAQSTNQAALHCLQMERLLKKEINLEEYEEKVMEFARNTLLWSREIGTSYLGSDLEYLNNKLRNRLARLAKRQGGSL
jgi:2-polyprenyl-6-methoxyphenol hydroxylase-like FAD-dependent oxidoreductase